MRQSPDLPSESFGLGGSFSAPKTSAQGRALLSQFQGANKPLRFASGKQGEVSLSRVPSTNPGRKFRSKFNSTFRLLEDKGSARARLGHLNTLEAKEKSIKKHLGVIKSLKQAPLNELEQVFGVKGKKAVKEKIKELEKAVKKHVENIKSYDKNKIEREWDSVRESYTKMVERREVAPKTVGKATSIKTHNRKRR